MHLAGKCGNGSRLPSWQLLLKDHVNFIRRRKLEMLKRKCFTCILIKLFATCDLQLQIVCQVASCWRSCGKWKVLAAAAVNSAAFLCPEP